MTLGLKEDDLKALYFFDDNEIFREYTTIIELHNALKFKTICCFVFKRYQGVALIKSVSILSIP